MTVFLYETHRKVELTIREQAGLENWNLPMDRNDFRLFKDVQNVVDFIVRDTDRKPISMIGRTAQINLYDQRTNTLLWTAPLAVIAEQKGCLRMTMPPSTMDGWNLAAYSYCVMVTNADTTTHMLFVNQDAGDRGYFEVLDGPRLDPTPSAEKTWEQFTESNDNDPALNYRVCTFVGPAQRENFAGICTAALYLDNFSGKVLVQGSLEVGTANPMTDDEWFTIDTLEFHECSCVKSHTFEANVMWVRYKIYRDQDLTTSITLPEDMGKITKISFRN